MRQLARIERGMERLAPLAEQEDQQPVIVDDALADLLAMIPDRHLAFEALAIPRRRGE